MLGRRHSSRQWTHGSGPVLRTGNRRAVSQRRHPLVRISTRGNLAGDAGDCAKARQASLHDDYVTATRIIKEATLQEKDEQIYEPFGTARIQYSTSADGRESMKRQLDLARALAGETFQMGDANVHVDAWCSEPDDLLVYRMSSDAPIDVNISVSGTFLKQSRASLETVSDGIGLPSSSWVGCLDSTSDFCLTLPKILGKMSRTEPEWRTPVRSPLP